MYSAASMFVLIFVTLDLGEMVKINDLQVPEVIQHGDPVVLDCDFTLEDADVQNQRNIGLVVKWWFLKFSGSKKLVYQWIPGSNKPQELGALKGRLNLEYTASLDANSVHRALHILKPGPDLSGDYTCHVETFGSEDEKTKSMLVFVPERNFVLRRVFDADKGYMRVQCSADGVYPKPSMTLRSLKRDIPEPDLIVRERGQLYDISASTTVRVLNDPEEFSCELRIPQANYTVRRETVLYSGGSRSSIWIVKWIFTTNCILMLWTP